VIDESDLQKEKHSEPMNKLHLFIIWRAGSVKVSSGWRRVTEDIDVM
jgi:hypothetical protein